MADYLIQALGYFASGLSFATFCMQTMLPLRCMAIASNIAFLTYGTLMRVWPIIILQCLLLPLNVTRFIQIRRLLAQIRAARSGELDMRAIVRSLKAEKRPQGSVLFRQGDVGDAAYYIATGEIDLPEIGARCHAGELLGEIAIFSGGGARTASAVCATDVELYRIDEHTIVTAFYQSPTFSFALCRLVTERLASNLSRLQRGDGVVQQEGAVAD